MKLYLVRHGQAEPMRADDAARQLTAKGRADIAALGRWMAGKKIHIDQAIVSPYQRARQTFDGLQQENRWPLEPMIEKAMTPDAVIDHVLAILGECEDNVATLVVSHQPLVSSLTALLVEGRTDRAFHYPMQPGSLAIIDLPECLPANGSLDSLLSPPYDG